MKIWGERLYRTVFQDSLNIFLGPCIVPVISCFKISYSETITKFYFTFSETGSHYIAQANLKLMVPCTGIYRPAQRVCNLFFLQAGIVLPRQTHSGIESGFLGNWHHMLCGVQDFHTKGQPKLWLAQTFSKISQKRKTIFKPIQNSTVVLSKEAQYSFLFVM